MAEENPDQAKAKEMAQDKATDIELDHDAGMVDDKAADIKLDHDAGIAQDDAADIKLDHGAGMAQDKAADIELDHDAGMAQDEATDIDKDHDTGAAQGKAADIEKDQAAGAAKEQTSDIDKDHDAGEAKEQPPDIDKDHDAGEAQDKAAYIEKDQAAGAVKEQISGVVVDQGRARFSDLWKKEDYWAIWLGFAILALGLYLFTNYGPEDFEAKVDQANGIMTAQEERAPFETIAWYQAADSKKKLKATGSSLAKTLSTYLGKPHKWSGANPQDAFILSGAAAEALTEAAKPQAEAEAAAAQEALNRAQAAEQAAADKEFKDPALNLVAKDAIMFWRITQAKADKAAKKAVVTPYNQIPFLVGLMVVFGVFFGIGWTVMGHSFAAFFKGFIFVFFIAVLAYFAESHVIMKQYGVGYAPWAIFIGLLIANTVGTPKAALAACQTEYFIKTGLVLLGAEILFGKILNIGLPGIFVAWVVTPIVLVTTYLFGQKVLKMGSKTLNITISADMSVCGVSAAIATAAACRAKKEELTLAVGLSLVFTSIMMIVMPIFIKALSMPEVLGGAWLGGTIDATGAVAAAGAFLGDKALYTAATIKMIQNVLIGVIAFCVAVYWCAKVDCQPGQKVGYMEIWRRFPKFVLGFIGASIAFSLLYSEWGADAGYTYIDHGVIQGLSKDLRGWFFCLAFASIGLATNFRELAHYFKGGKPLILYVCGQSLNLILTLTMAYVMFYLVFPEITAKI
jgi:uncharacterized membrane protein YadS